MNADFLCPDCGKVHKNAVIEGFNRFLSIADPRGEFGEAEKRVYFRVYCAGQHDALHAVLICSSEEPDPQLLNAYAIQLRAAIMQAAPDLPEEERNHMHYCLTEKFFIRDGKCAYGN